MFWCCMNVGESFKVAKSARVVLEDCVRAEGARTGVILSLFPSRHSP